MLPLRSTYTIDFHVHVDERVKYQFIPSVLRARGLDGVGLLTHNNYSFARKITQRFKEIDKKKFYFSGVEVDTNDGHLIAFGIDREIPQNLSSEETIELIHDLGGVTIIPHPFMSHNSIGWKSYILKSDAMEFSNGFAKIFFNFPNYMTEVAFKNNGFGKIGGSDAHYVNAIGTCYSLVKMSEELSDDTILEAIRKHKTEPKIRFLDVYDLGNFFKTIFTPKLGRKVFKIFNTEEKKS